MTYEALLILLKLIDSGHCNITNRFVNDQQFKNMRTTSDDFCHSSQGIARQTEICTELRAESQSKYRSEFWSIFTIFIHIFSQVVADDIHTGLVSYSRFVWAATGSGRLGRNRQVGEQLVNPARNLFKNCSYYPMNKRVGHSCNSGASAAANQLLLYSSLPGSSSRSAFSVHAGYG